MPTTREGDRDRDREGRGGRHKERARREHAAASCGPIQSRSRWFVFVGQVVTFAVYGHFFVRTVSAQFLDPASGMPGTYTCNPLAHCPSRPSSLVPLASPARPLPTPVSR